MASLRDQLCAEALTWVGTPFQHLQCCKGAGVDCAQLLYAVGRSCGCLAATWRCPVYSAEYHLHQENPLFLQTLEALGCIAVPVAQRQPGDIVMFRWQGHQPSHAGILVTPDTMVHALFEDRVRHHSVRGVWLQRLAAVYMFPGVSV